MTPIYWDSPFGMVRLTEEEGAMYICVSDVNKAIGYNAATSMYYNLRTAKASLIIFNDFGGRGSANTHLVSLVDLMRWANTPKPRRDDFKYERIKFIKELQLAFPEQFFTGKKLERIQQLRNEIYALEAELASVQVQILCEVPNAA